MFPWEHITWLWFAIVITEWSSEGAFLCSEATFLMASLTILQETVFYFDFIIMFSARSITYTSVRAIVEYVRKYSEKTCAFSKRWVFARKTLRFGRNRSVKRSAFRPNAAFFSTRELHEKATERYPINHIKTLFRSKFDFCDQLMRPK